MREAALGCTVGTGWVVAVVVTLGDGDGGRHGGDHPMGRDRGGPGLQVIDRRRVELVSGDHRFAYHAAAEREPAEASAAIAAVEAEAADAATAAFRGFGGGLAEAGHRLVGATVVGPGSVPDQPLETILASHAAIHAAEGALYRTVVHQACGDLGLPVSTVPAKGLADRVAAALDGHLDTDAVVAAVADVRRSIGPPWRREHKDAALAAWLTLLTRSA